MRAFTPTEIRAHFEGVRYSEYAGFVGLLVRRKILIKVSPGKYTYDLDKLSETAVVEVAKQCKERYFRQIRLT